MIDAAHHIKVMEEEVDKVHKVSMYLIEKYKNELIEEFKDKVTPKEDFSRQEFLMAFRRIPVRQCMKVIL